MSISTETYKCDRCGKAGTSTENWKKIEIDEHRCFHLCDTCINEIKQSVVPSENGIETNGKGNKVMNKKLMGDKCSKCGVPVKGESHTVNIGGRKQPKYCEPCYRESGIPNL